MKNKILKIIGKTKSYILTYILTNKQFLAFVLLMTFETAALGILTMGINTWGIKALFFDFAAIITLGSIGYLFKPKKQYIYFQTILILITIICIINGIYYTFYDSFVTVGLIESLGQVNTVTDAIFEKLNPLHGIYIFAPIAFYLIHKSLNNHNYFNYVTKIEKSKKNFATTLLIGIILLCINIITLNSADISRLVKQWNREYIVERYGIITYQINDIFQNAQSRIFSYFGYDEAAQKFIDYYNNKDTQNKNNKYTGIYEGKNLLFIHMESMMSMFIDMKINEIEVTPNLNRLSKEGIYFTNFYPEVSVGTSSDTEFTLSTSLMPALSGTVFVNYYDRNYQSIQKIFKEKNYYTFSMHGNNSTMWNRSLMHTSLGYDKFYSKEFYNVTKENSIGLGISDHDFFTQSIDYLNSIEKENKNYMGTMITLTNHTPWDGKEAYGQFDLTKTVEKINPETDKIETIKNQYLEETKIGDYIKSVHYADACLGEFIESIYKNDLLNNTVIVFYGDHDAKLSTKEYNYLYNYDPELGRLKNENDPGFIKYDYYENELNRKTPLIIWTKDHKIKEKVNYYMGMIDVLPTLGNMFNFKNKYALGHDIFDIKDNNMVIFPNGNFLTNKVYYNNSKSEYKILNEKTTIVDENYIPNRKRETEEILELSNNIIVYDLIEREGDKIKNEKP